ncbi:MAG: DUF2865 domain-containing protein [Alphaproteobacteria bacterium]|nr:DUF2865 domain-containing protein [Alphaproteobacteria bacterium]
MTGASLFAALSVLAFIAGPGFFTAMLLVALFKDVPSAPTRQLNIKSLSGAAASTGSVGLLSPVSEPMLPDRDKPEIVSAAGTSSENPVTTYMRLTGNSNYTSLAFDREDGDSTSYRTVCVRLCDGSYFPISDHATPDRFAADETQCRSRCGAPARLYVYANGRETPLQMRDLSGNAYLELETAFKFQIQYDAQCNCRAQPWTALADARHDRYAQFEAVERSLRVGLQSAGPTNLSAKTARASNATVLTEPGRSIICDATPRLIASVGPANGLASIAVREASPAVAAAIEAELINEERIADVTRRSQILGSIELPAWTSPTRQQGPASEARTKAAAQLKLASIPPAALGLKLKEGTVKVAEITAGHAPQERSSATEILMRNINPHY